MDQNKIKKTIKTAAIFTIAPAVAIVISVMTLSKKLGLPMPWLRLSVVGSMSYETIAANNALSAMGQSLGSDVPLNAQQYVNLILVNLFQAKDLLLIFLGLFLLHCPSGGKGQARMSRKADGLHASFDGGKHHLLGSILSVTEAGVGMKITFWYHIVS